MPTLLLVLLETAEIISIIQSLPKLRQIYYDPLMSHSFKTLFNHDESLSDNYLSNSLVLNTIRTRGNLDNIENEGYIFNGNICRYTNRRILCGYNKNKDYNNEEKSVDLGNGCNLRGERIECGYVKRSLSSKILQENLITTNILREAVIVETSNTKFANFKDVWSRKAANTKNRTINKNDLFKKSAPAITTNEPEPIAVTSPFSHMPTKKLTVINFTTKANPNTTTRSTMALLKVNEDDVENINTKDINIIIHNETLTNKSNNIFENNKPTDHMITKPLNKISKIATENYRSSSTWTNISQTDTKTITITTNNPKYFQNNDVKAKIRTACYEHNDRIVCYDYKTII